ATEGPVPGQVALPDQRGQEFTLLGAEELVVPGGVRVGEVLPSVEPDVSDLERQVLRAEQLDEPLDVVGVDVTQHQQLEPTGPALRVGNRPDLLLDPINSPHQAAVDEKAAGLLGVSVLDPQGIAQVRGQHLDGEHGPPPCRAWRQALRRMALSSTLFEPSAAFRIGSRPLNNTAISSSWRLDAPSASLITALPSTFSATAWAKRR